MLNFEKIKYYFNTLDVNGNKMWKIDMVKGAVVKGKITTEEYKTITNEDYIA